MGGDLSFSSSAVDMASWSILWWSRMVLGSVFILYLLSILRLHLKPFGSDRSTNVTVTNLAGGLINLLAFWYLSEQLPLLRLVFERALDFSPDHRIWVAIHAYTFLAVILLVVVRAYYVVNEFDNGLYLFSPALPIRVAKLPALGRWLEVCMRFFIILVLLAVAANFMKRSAPFDAASRTISLAENLGSTLLAEGATECKRFDSLRNKAHQTVSGFDECLVQHVSGFDRAKTHSTIQEFFDQIVLFPIALGLMLLWSLTMFWVARRPCDEELREKLLEAKKHALWQLVIPTLGLGLYFLTKSWFEHAIGSNCIVCGMLKPLSPEHGHLIDLVVLAILGAVCGLSMLVAQTLRSAIDFWAFWSKWKTWRASPKSSP